MTHIVLLTLALFASFSCTKPKDKSEGEGDGTANPSTSSGTNSTNTGTDTETSTGSDSELSLSAPATFIDGDIFDAASDHYTLSWSSVVNALSYEVAVGTTSGATDVLDWQDVGNNTSISTSTLSLPAAGMFYASVRAVGENDTKGEIATGDGWQHLICPTNWVRIPGNTTGGLGGSAYVNGTRTRHDGSTRTLSDFCVMKYEAKLEIDGTVQPEGDDASDEINLDVAGGNVAMNGNIVETNGSYGGGAGLVVRPVSSATGKPWVRASRNTDGGHVVGAEGLCASLGDGYTLISNAQWQAIARNIEAVSENFDTSGPVAEHSFNRGHSDGTDALAASTNDAEGCANYIATDAHDNTAVSATCDDAWHLNKRTHALTNGEVIWDLSGNVYEWVRDDSSSLQGFDGYMHVNTFSAALLLKWGPEEDYSAQTNTARYGGLGYFYDDSAGAVLRGGYWPDGTNAGPFDASLNDGPSSSASVIGFRCVFAP